MAVQEDPKAIQLELLSTSFTRLKGVYWSSERQEALVADEHLVLSFQAEHGKNGIFHQLAGSKLHRGEPSVKSYNDGMAHNAKFEFNAQVTFCEDAHGSLLVSDPGSHAIRSLDLSLKHVSTVVGPKETNYYALKQLVGRSTAVLHRPSGITWDSSGRLIIVDSGSHRILRLLDDKDTFESLGGQFVTPGYLDASPSASLFNKPFGVVNIIGYGLVVTDTGNRVIRVIPKSGITFTLAGTGEMGTADGPALSATFSNPQNICANLSGDIIVTDPSSNRIRLIQDGIVSTILRPKLVPGYMPVCISGMAVNGDGDLLLSDRNGLFKLYMSEDFKKDWNLRHNILSPLKFSDILEIDSDEILEKLCPITIELPNISKTIRFPKALLAIRCPALLDPGVVTSFQNLNISGTSVDIFMEYLFNDTLTGLTQDLAPEIVHLAAIALLTRKEALHEHCLWLTFVYALEGGSTERLVRSLKAAIEVDLQPAVTDLMKAIVTHNRLFSNPEHIALLQSSLSADRRAELKKFLQKNDVLPVVRLRQRPPERLFGSMHLQYADLLKHSLSEGAIEPDLALVCMKEGERHAIPCHAFVLYARWLYVRPLLKYSFKESNARELELLKPNGELFDFSWASHFLAFLYHGGLSGLEDASFCQTTADLSDYLLLLSPGDAAAVLSSAHHQWFVTRLRLSQPLHMAALKSALEEISLQTEM
jgi:hypothetical protein